VTCDDESERRKGRASVGKIDDAGKITIFIQTGKRHPEVDAIKLFTAVSYEL
jgi:hypothetical protein